jgi:hypothetical protein
MDTDKSDGFPAQDISEFVVRTSQHDVALIRREDGMPATTIDERLIEAVALLAISCATSRDQSGR